MLDLIGKYLVQMLKIFSMFVGNLIKMLMLLVDKNALLNLLFLFIRIGLKLGLLEKLRS